MGQTTVVAAGRCCFNRPSHAHTHTNTENPPPPSVAHPLESVAKKSKKWAQKINKSLVGCRKGLLIVTVTVTVMQEYTARNAGVGAQEADK